MVVSVSCIFAFNFQIGMVAWQMTLFTPEYPKGRDVIVICNDITFQIGSFGPKEDILFLKSSQRARKLKVSSLLEQ